MSYTDDTNVWDEDEPKNLNKVGVFALRARNRQRYIRTVEKSILPLIKGGPQ